MVNKIINAIIIGYGAFYVFLEHSIHRSIALDWLLGNALGFNGFPHVVHVALGALLIFYGLMLWTGKAKAPKLLKKLY